MLAAAPVLALVTAAAVGTVVGGVLAYVLAAEATSDWDEFGADLMGALVGALVAVVAYVAALIFAAWRMFPAGRRAMPVVLTLLGHAAVGGVVSVLVIVLRPTEAGEVAIAVLVVLAAVGCGPAVFLRFGATGRARRVAVPALAAIVAVTSVVAVVSDVARRADGARVLAEMTSANVDARAGQLRLYRLSYAPEAALVLVFEGRGVLGDLSAGGSGAVGGADRHPADGALKPSSTRRGSRSEPGLRQPG